MGNKGYYVGIYGFVVQVGPFTNRHEASDWAEKEFKLVVVVGERLIWELRSPERNCFFRGVRQEHIGSIKENGFDIEISQGLWCNMAARARPWEVTFE